MDPPKWPKGFPFLPVKPSEGMPGPKNDGRCNPPPHFCLSFLHVFLFWGRGSATQIPFGVGNYASSIFGGSHGQDYVPPRGPGENEGPVPCKPGTLSDLAPPDEPIRQQAHLSTESKTVRSPWATKGIRPPGTSNCQKALALGPPRSWQ